jgi:hypothetical protein
MFSNPDLSARHTLRRAPAALLGVVAMTVLLAGCAGPSGLNAADTTSTTVMPSMMSDPIPVPVSPVAPPPRTAMAPTTDAVTRMLAYAQKVRLMAPAELNQEASRLGTGASPTEQMQLSLVLSQLLQLPERIRAQELLARVLANPAPEAQALHPLAGLLASRYVELRRLEEQLEKQTQQTREVQRRLDQTTERLEALKAIERSLTNRANRAPAP